MQNHNLAMNSAGLDLRAYPGSNYYGEGNNLPAHISDPTLPKSEVPQYGYSSKNSLGENNSYGNPYQGVNSDYNNSHASGSATASSLDSLQNLYAKTAGLQSHESAESREYKPFDSPRPASATLRAYSLPHGHMQDVPVKTEYPESKNEHVVQRHQQESISGYPSSAGTVGTPEYGRDLTCASAVGGSSSLEGNSFSNPYQNIPRAHSQSATTSFESIQKEGLFSNSPGLPPLTNNEEDSKFRMHNWANSTGLASSPYESALIKKEMLHDNVDSSLLASRQLSQGLPYTTTADMSSAYAHNLQSMVSGSAAQSQQYQNALQYYNMYQQSANSGLNFGQQFLRDNKALLENYSRQCNMNSSAYGSPLQSHFNQASYFPAAGLGYGMGMYAGPGYRPNMYGGQAEQYSVDPYAQAQAAKRRIYNVQDGTAEKKGKKWGKRMKVEDEDEDDDYDYSLCNQWHVLSKEHIEENVPTIFNFHLNEDTLSISDRYMLVERRLCEQLKQIQFQRPVSHIYNPLIHAFETHSDFVRKYCNAEKPLLFLGMNPGPFGMVQNGVPFGEVSVVRDWFCVKGRVVKPSREHPNRPVVGLEFRRAEVSGSRFWGFFKKHCGCPENFFKKCFVHNLCPLAFMSRSGRNLTPPDLSLMDRNLLNQTCSIALLELIEILGVQDIIAVGRYVEARALQAVKEGNVTSVRIHCLQHPSPLNPQANKGWDDIAYRTLREKDLLQYFDIADSEG